ncbi:uncharacterized protein [Procambarus clarkii]|uniref:uncharacterized protein n=1 Tax=Procambarus clarkii TaxID=6728 RepID=UPI0037432873
MVWLSFVATLYIIIGGLEFLLNLMASTFIISRRHSPIMPLTIYGLSDTVSSALTGIGLLCDGCLYFTNLMYSNSCSRYFLIFSLLIFAIVTSNFSTLGSAIEHYQGVFTVFPQSRNFQNTSTFSLMWTMSSWFIALIFVSVIWGHTKVFSVYDTQNNTLYLESSRQNRNNRGLLENLWERNSQYDWSSDYRENVIIGLIYGIVGGNISHTALEKFHGIAHTKEKQTENLQIIKQLHSTLGITDEDQQRIFGEIGETLFNKNQLKNLTILDEIQNPIQTNNETDNLTKSDFINFKTFKPSSTAIIKNLQNNSLMNDSKISETVNGIHKPMKDHVQVKASITNVTTPAINTNYLEFVDTKMRTPGAQMKTSNPQTVTPDTQTVTLDVQTVTPDAQTVTPDIHKVNSGVLIINKHYNFSNNPEELSSITELFLDKSDTTLEPYLTTDLQKQSSSLTQVTETTVLYTDNPCQELETENISIDVTAESDIPVTTPAHNKIHEGSYSQDSKTEKAEHFEPTIVPFYITNSTMMPIYSTKYESKEELENAFLNTTSSNKILINITRGKQHESTALGITQASDENGIDLSMTIIPSNITTTDYSTSDHLLATLTIFLACQPNFLPTFMTVLFVMVYAIPLLASGGLYIRTAWILCYHTPLQTTVSAYSYWSHTKKATCWGVVMLSTNFGCWTPFMVERLLYAWEVIDEQPSIVPATLFLITRIHSLLRGIVYVFNHAEVLGRVSAIPTATVHSSGCTSTLVNIEGAPQRIGQSFITPSMERNTSRASLLVSRSPINSNRDSISSINMQENLFTIPLSNTCTTPLPNMPDLV